MDTILKYWPILALGVAGILLVLVFFIFYFFQVIRAFRQAAAVHTKFGAIAQQRG